MGTSMTGQRLSGKCVMVMTQITDPLSRLTRGADPAPPPCSARVAWPGVTPRAVQWVGTRGCVQAEDLGTGQLPRMSHSRWEEDICHPLCLCHHQWSSREPWRRPGGRAAWRRWAGASWPTTAGATATGCAGWGSSLQRSASRKHHSGQFMKAALTVWF